MTISHKRLLPRPNNNIQEISPSDIITETPVETPIETPVENPVINTRTPTPEKCRPEYYQKRLLSYNEIKGKICQLYFREESKSKYQQEMLEISTKRKFGKNAKYPEQKYCDIVKKDPKFIAGLLQADMIVPETLRDYCFLSVRERHFK